MSLEAVIMNTETGRPPRGERSAGEKLRRLRMRLGLTTRKVEEMSRIVAQDQGGPEFSVSHARLVQIENGETAPSIQKLFTLGTVYGMSVVELLSYYFDLQAAARLHSQMDLPTHPLSITERTGIGPVGGRNHSGFAPLNTGPLSNLAEIWGEAATPMLGVLNGSNCRYAVIGASDYMMYPLLRPGSVVQFEECRKPDPRGSYQNEYDRPIYLIELHTGYLCCWCELQKGRLTVLPHPLSPCSTQQFAFPSEAEILGRVTGVAARLTRGADCSAAIAVGT